MSWATHAIVRLAQGETVPLRPRGRSMVPVIAAGSHVRVAPLDSAAIVPGDIVLCHLPGRDVLHLVLDVGPQGYLVGNAQQDPHGWVARPAIFGKVVRS